MSALTDIKRQIAKECGLIEGELIEKQAKAMQSLFGLAIEARLDLAADARDFMEIAKTLQCGSTREEIIKAIRVLLEKCNGL